MGSASSRASTAEATASEAPFSSAETEAAGSEALWLAAPEEAAEEAEEDAEEAELSLIHIALKKFEGTLKEDNYEKRKGFFKKLKDMFNN